ncbi:teicoplanin resistance protein VanZ [Shewanella sp. NFH-SH190041]|uniref:VanZ family protein n=1 Tax=Shewanella sp. NFH-SH190041 TaxID=2950245 RepID=UPI0021C37A9C|nr:VanZ family protein [Shewanella sp. NFH-SH190041]BDM63331.1 teicoplanin resistance protein VanZ [Shewanella sp. NFH-SH190041]
MISRIRFFKFALLAALLVVSYLVFSRPDYPQDVIPNMDKIGHLGSFFLLSWLSYEAFRPRWQILVPTMAVYAVGIEFVQSFLPYRSASVGDVVADMLGVALFYMLLKPLSGISQRLFERGDNRE